MTDRTTAEVALQWGAAALDVAMVAVVAVHLLASLLLLPFGVPAWIERRGEPQVTYDRALLLPPARLYVEGLAIDVPDRFGRWHIEARTASGLLDPWALASRTFAVRGLRGDGVAIVHEPHPASAPPREPAVDPWDVRLRAVDLPHLDVFGAAGHRVTGGIGLSGDLHVAGTTTFGGRVTCETCELRGPRGELVARLDGEVDVQDVVGRRGEALSLEILRHVDGTARVSGHVPDLSALDIQASLAPWARLSGEARGDLDLAFRDGDLLVDSVVRLDGEPLGIRLGRYLVSGQGEIVMRILDADDEPTTLIEATFPEYGWFDDQPGGARLAHGRDLSLEVRTPSASLVEIHSPIEGHLELPPTHVDDVGVARRWIPRGSGVAVTGGAATVSGVLDASVGDAPKAEGSLKIDIDDLSLRWDADDIVTDGHVDVEIVDGDVSAGAFSLDGTRVRLSDLGYAGVVEGRTWWADLELLHGDLQTDDGPRLDARLAFSIADSSPVVSLLDRDDSTAWWVRKLLSRRDVTGRGTLLVAPDAYRLRDFRIEAGDHALIKLHLLRDERVRRAAVFAKLGLLSVGVELEQDARKIHLFDADSWYHEHEPTL